jgi:hypothetical protein
MTDSEANNQREQEQTRTEYEKPYSKEGINIFVAFCAIIFLLVFFFGPWEMIFPFAVLAFASLVFAAIFSFSWGGRLVTGLILLGVFFGARNHIDDNRIRRVRGVEAEMRNIAIALESFRAFEGRLPTVREYYDATKLNDGTPSFVLPIEKTLTSPVSHIATLPGDPFREQARSHHYGYITVDGRWALRSYGPDKDADVDLDELMGVIAGASHVGWNDEQLQWFYDPTNGIESTGDIIKTGP